MSINQSVNQSTGQLTIGLFGFGVVGKGLYDVLHTTPTLQASIKKICIKNAGKKRSIPAENFTTEAALLLNDESINVIVELIDDADAAYHIVKTALQKGKAVVSANNKMIAEHFEELLQLQQENNTAFLYEAACCASMPIVRNLEEYYDNDLLKSIRGIINGSTNFILTKIFEEELEFREALTLAQQAGFAESNPKLDVGGFDAAKKLESGKLAAFVLPQFVTPKDDLYHVQNEFNALTTESSFADTHFFKGKGAGAFPTASAVLSDISALRYNYKYEYKKIHHRTDTQLSTDYYLKVFISTDDLAKIRKEDFEWIEEWHNGFKQSWLVAVIHAGKLFHTGWWKQEGVSLILCPEPIIENIDYRKISKRSLELAGVI